MKSLLFSLFFLVLPLYLIPTHSQETPGVQFLGKGYDVYFANLYDTSGNGDQGWKEQVFQFTTNQGLKTPDGLWIVPDYTTSTILSSCSVEQSENIINDGFDYQNAVNTGVGIDLSLFNASFQFSIDSKHIANTTTDKQSIYVQMQSTCSAYQLTMNAYKTPNVTEDFREGVETLTDAYDEDAYMEFVQTFGTHYIRELSLGGLWGWLIEFNRNDFQNMLDNGVNWNLGLAYAGEVKAGLTINSSVETSTAITVIRSISHNFTYNIGGDYKPDSASWMASIKANPMPIKIETIPIWNLITAKYFPNTENINGKKALLMNATLNYCVWLQQNVDSSVKCASPQKLPHPSTLNNFHSSSVFLH